MRQILLIACLILTVKSRPQASEGFNPGSDSGFNGGGDSNNPGFHIPDFVPDESVSFPGGRGGSGYNPGVEEDMSDSGFNPGYSQDSGSHEGSNRPDSKTGNSGFNPGSSGYNPGSHEGSSRPDSKTGNSGFNPGNGGFNPGNGGFNPGSPGSSGFKTPIVFAEDEEVVDTKKSSLPPYQPGGDKTPYLRGTPDNNMASSLPPYQPGGDKTPYLRGTPSDDQPRFYLLQQLPYNPLISTEAEGQFISASTLPSPIQFAVADQPYVPGGNKQQYLRGDSEVVAVEAAVANFPVAVATTGPYVPGGNKQQYLRGRQTAVAGPYVPGGNKQQYLRNSAKQTRPVDSSVIPLLTAENPLFGQQTAQTLPSPIVFAPAAMTNTPQTKPFLPQTQQNFVPLIRLGNGAQTLPSPIVFDEAKQTKPFNPQSQNFVPLIRLGNGAQTLPSPIVFDDTRQTRPVLDTRNFGNVQTLPAGVSSPYTAGGNKQQYLRSNVQEAAGDQGVYPGVSARPNFPPGFISRMLNENLSYQDNANNGPKNVLYFF